MRASPRCMAVRASARAGIARAALPDCAAAAGRRPAARAPARDSHDEVTPLACAAVWKSRRPYVLSSSATLSCR
jgi:hypothetical protein